MWEFTKTRNFIYRTDVMNIYGTYEVGAPNTIHVAITAVRSASEEGQNHAGTISALEQKYVREMMDAFGKMTFEVHDDILTFVLMDDAFLAYRRVFALMN